MTGSGFALETPPLLSSLNPEGMLFAATIHSPIAKSGKFRLLHDALPDNYICMTSNDLVASGLSTRFSDELPLFALERIEYRGQALGLIIGPDAAMCDSLAASIAVDGDILEPELDWECFSSSQIVHRTRIEHGDVDAGFAHSVHVERSTYHNGIVDHHYTEAVGALAVPTQDGVTMYCASQWPSQLRNAVAHTLRIPESGVGLVPCDLGRPLDGKLWYPALVACHAAAASRITGKPVKILYSRMEDFLHTPKHARSAVAVRTGTDAAGRLMALEVRILINIGAYNPLARELVQQAVSAATGIYACPAIRIEGFAIRSDILPLGALGSIGSTHAFFSIESHMNHIAKTCGITPAEIKAINILGKGMSNFGTLPLTSDIPFLKINRKLELLSDYKRKYASYELVKKRDPGFRAGLVRGIALTLGYQTSRSLSGDASMNLYSVHACLDRDLVLVISGDAAIGSPQVKTMWRRTASEILSIPEGKIHFSLPDPQGPALPSGPMTLSRGVTTIHRLIEKTCKDIQRRRFRESLPLKAKAQTRTAMNLKTPGAAQPGGSFFDGASWCGTAVEVEIDPLTGEPVTKAIWMVVDAGRIVAKDEARASMRSAIISALGLCTGEIFDPDTADEELYHRDRLSALTELPAIEVEFIDPDRAGPARGIGELPFLTIPAAFHSALTQALGRQPRRLPLTGRELLDIMEAT
jgi:CO/xanthine dehydrogenase Mo-binding subunit